MLYIVNTQSLWGFTGVIESELPVITDVVELCAHILGGPSVQPLGIAHFPRAAVNS